MEAASRWPQHFRESSTFSQIHRKTRQLSRVNRTAAGNPRELPNGSIVIQENYGPDQKKLKAVTVLYRSKDYNPDAGDGYWVKYNADGTVAKAPPEMKSMPLAGKLMGCIQCHGDAHGGDFAFFNNVM